MQPNWLRASSRILFATCEYSVSSSRPTARKMTTYISVTHNLVIYIGQERVLGGILLHAEGPLLAGSTSSLPQLTQRGMELDRLAKRRGADEFGIHGDRP